MTGTDVSGWMLVASFALWFPGGAAAGTDLDGTTPGTIRVMID